MCVYIKSSVKRAHFLCEASCVDLLPTQPCSTTQHHHDALEITGGSELKRQKPGKNTQTSERKSENMILKWTQNLLGGCGKIRQVALCAFLDLALRGGQRARQRAGATTFGLASVKRTCARCCPTAFHGSKRLRNRSPKRRKFILNKR